MPLGAITAGATVFKNVFSPIGNLFSKPESQADKDKQQIQEEIRALGYPELTKMKGWQGNEKAKKNAMKTILAVLEKAPGAGQQIVGFLENGQVTPETIKRVDKLRLNLPTAFTGEATGNANSTIQRTKSGTQRVPLIGASFGGQNTGFGLIAVVLALVGIGIAYNKGVFK